MLTSETADAFCVTTTLLALDLLQRPPNDRRLRLIISYPGGKYGAGMRMADQVRRLRALGITVEAVIRGQAGSMTAVLAAACSRTVMALGSSLLLHGLTVIRFAGSLDGMRVRVAKLEAQVHAVAEVLHERATRGERRDQRLADYGRLVTLLSSDVELTLSAEEALAAGMIDEIVESHHREAA